MTNLDPAAWPQLLEGTLACYDEALLRQVAGRLVKSRNYWPVADLVARCVDTVGNPAVLDRRLRELEPAGRQLLALLGHSRQPRWALGNLVELMMALGHEDGLGPIFDLLSAGLLFPVVETETGEGNRKPTVRVRTFEQWLANPGPAGLAVFSPPQVAARALGEDLGLPDLPWKEEGGEEVSSSFQEADGLEWLLRLGVLWQQVAGAPLRLTQQGGFFKRDLERLGQDPLLNGPPADRQADLPDVGFLVAALADLEGVVREADGEVRAGALPAAWEAGLAQALEALYRDLPRLQTWNPLDGWRQSGANPFPSAYLLSLLLLARVPPDAWVSPDAVEGWLSLHHPYWVNEGLRPSRQEPWVERFLLGLAYQLKLVQVSRGPDGGSLVRLAPTGRWLLGLGGAPPAEPAYQQTLLVQPNLEIVAYRQGLTAGLIAKLTRFAAWKSLGAACTLQLGPETVYRALEAGETFESIRLALDQHGTRATPAAVLDSLRTWSNKRDRITVYPAAALLEFNSAAELNEALARGLPGVRIADTLALVASEDAIDFRHFRLTGTRDYGLPPDRCVSVEPDGVTLAVDLARADLMLETEMPRFAEPVERSGTNGRRLCRLTPASLGAARASGLTLSTLEAWFQQRAGQGLPPAARLLLTGAQVESPRLRRHLVLHVAVPELADGLMQWPETRSLIDSRLGPTALVVAEEQVEELRQRLAEAGIALQEESSGS